MTNRTRRRASCGTFMPREAFTEPDNAVREAFGNFLSWGIRPDHQDVAVPPAVWAYRFGATLWCPPRGVM